MKLKAEKQKYYKFISYSITSCMASQTADAFPLCGAKNGLWMHAVCIDALLTPFFLYFIYIYLLYETVRSRNANLIPDMAGFAAGRGSCLHAKDKIMEYPELLFIRPSVWLFLTTNLHRKKTKDVSVDIFRGSCVGAPLLVAKSNCKVLFCLFYINKQWRWTLNRESSRSQLKFIYY